MISGKNNGGSILGKVLIGTDVPTYAATGLETGTGVLQVKSTFSFKVIGVSHGNRVVPSNISTCSPIKDCKVRNVKLRVAIHESTKNNGGKKSPAPG